MPARDYLFGMHERDARASGGGLGIISLNIAMLTADFFIQI